MGGTIIVRDLASGRDTTFGNVSDYAWEDSKSGHLLAMTISADGQVGNGVHLYNPDTTVLRVLDSESSTYSGLAWREDEPHLAVLRSETDDAHEGPTQVALAWKGLGMPAEQRLDFDPTTTSSFPTGMRTVTFRAPSWSDDGSMLFVGVAEWADKPPTPERGRGGRGGRGDGRGGGRGQATDDAVEPDQ